MRFLSVVGRRVIKLLFGSSIEWNETTENEFMECELINGKKLKQYV